MRHASIALALASSLLLATSCAPVTPGAPQPAGQTFRVMVQPPEVCCKVTGGGFICDPRTSEKITFGFNATSLADGTASGEVEVVDHGTGYNFHGSTITGVTCQFIHEGNDVLYTITGDLAQQSSGYPGTFTLIVRDNGEPGNNNSGKGTDTFNFTVNTGSLAGYNASGWLAGGNIQAHEYGNCCDD